LGEDSGVAYVRGAQEALKGGATRALHGCAGGPWGKEVAENGGIVLVDPWEAMGRGGFEGPGEAMGETPVVAEQTTARFDEWFEGPHVGALGVEGRAGVAMRAQELKRECGVSGIGLGVAGREGFVVRGQG
jgi:hypothetical protein